ncbi:hypothetical protein AAFC00_002571 [Neodothiora populina]|uniref:Zinc knuckle-domain-containing protein n=1 Tax=Neodothiora populina TaxID=2781224 RepID=A0ABR3P7T1_9PEZI
MIRHGRGGSKASSTTLCQKCLKRGHYSYECKSATQERPYQSRPSRTQQLLNPKLAPKLTNAAPEEPRANEMLIDRPSTKEGSKRKRSVDLAEVSRKRSVSSYSSDSVASVSTRSPSPPMPSQPTSALRHSRLPPSDSMRETSLSPLPGKAKRPRRDGSVSSSRTREYDDYTADSERRTRLRRGSTSPGERGRRRGRSQDSRQRHHRSGSARPSTADSRRSAPRYDEPRGEKKVDTKAGYHAQETDSARNMSRAQDPVAGFSATRQRSLSPYSKRVALSQGKSIDGR